MRHSLFVALLAVAIVAIATAGPACVHARSAARSAASPGAHVTPRDLSLSEAPEVRAWVKKEGGKNVRFLDLKVSCKGRRLYGLSFLDPGYTGSGGSRVVFFVRACGKVMPLFDDVLVDWWGAESASDCPPIIASVRHLGVTRIVPATFPGCGAP